MDIHEKFMSFETHFALETGDPSNPYRPFTATDEDIPHLPWVERDENDKVNIMPQMLTMYLRNRNTILAARSGENGQPLFYHYEGGVYARFSEVDMKHMIKNFLPPLHRRTSHWNSVYNEFITDAPELYDYQLNTDEDLVNFKNGLYKLSSGELLPHSRYVLSTIQVDCEYRLDLDSSPAAPVFMQFLQTLTSNDHGLITLLLEYLGGVLSNVHGYRFKKMLILVGPGNTGKTQLRSLAMRIVGKQNCHAIDLKSLNSRFGTSQIYGKRLIGSGDLAFSVLDEVNTVKEIVGGDEINAERKGKDGFSYTFTGFVWMNANELPLFRGDRGEHVYERFLIVPCLNVVELQHRDPHLLEKMYAEREAIVVLALQAFKAALDRECSFTEPAVIFEQRERYAKRNNSLQAFVEEMCTLKSDHMTRRSEFKRTYIAWCTSSGLLAEPAHNIEAQLVAICNIHSKKTYGEHYYMGISINEWHG